MKLSWISTSLKIHGSLKNDQFVVAKLKNLYKYCPASIVTTFNTNFLLLAKRQNSNSWNIWSAGLCGKTIALNLGLESEIVFWCLLMYIGSVGSRSSYAQIMLPQTNLKFPFQF